VILPQPRHAGTDIYRRLGPTTVQSNKSWEELEETLPADMCVIADFLSAWKLPLSVTETTSTAFHLNNKETKRQLAVNFRSNALSTWIVNCPASNMLRTCQKILARNNILRCLAGSSWGASTLTIRTAAFAIVFRAAEYAASVWFRSAHSKNLLLH